MSGKGEQAGTRALLLSGAFGGLLTALPPADFLPAANDYLLRQDWEEGFATAVHLSVELATGRYEIRTAGHPPAVQLAAGSGRWTTRDTEGPVLGLIHDAEFPLRQRAPLGHGDALLLYTDGMVETPTRDIGLGIDRMVGQAERLLRGQFIGGAARSWTGSARTRTTGRWSSSTAAEPSAGPRAGSSAAVRAASFVVAAPRCGRMSPAF